MAGFVPCVSVPGGGRSPCRIDMKRKRIGEPCPLTNGFGGTGPPPLPRRICWSLPIACRIWAIAFSVPKPGSMRPSAMPVLRCWNVLIAPLVLGPMSPSTASGGDGPPCGNGISLSARWTSVTSSRLFWPPKPTEPLMSDVPTMAFPEDRRIVAREDTPRTTIRRYASPDR